MAGAPPAVLSQGRDSSEQVRPGVIIQVAREYAQRNR
jgi:hypothetical protein